MPTVSVPVRLTLEPGATSNTDDIADAVAAAVARAVGKARRHVDTSGEVVVHPPTLSWVGPGATTVDAETRRRIEQAVCSGVSTATSSLAGPVPLAPTSLGAVAPSGPFQPPAPSRSLSAVPAPSAVPATAVPPQPMSPGTQPSVASAEHVGGAATHDGGASEPGLWGLSKEELARLGARVAELSGDFWGTEASIHRKLDAARSRSAHWQTIYLAIDDDMLHAADPQSGFNLVHYVEIRLARAVLRAELGHEVDPLTANATLEHIRWRTEAETGQLRALINDWAQRPEKTLPYSSQTFDQIVVGYYQWLLHERQAEHYGEDAIKSFYIAHWNGLVDVLKGLIDMYEAPIRWVLEKTGLRRERTEEEKKQAWSFGRIEYEKGGWGAKYGKDAEAGVQTGLLVAGPGLLSEIGSTIAGVGRVDSALTWLRTAAGTSDKAVPLVRVVYRAVLTYKEGAEFVGAAAMLYGVGRALMSLKTGLAVGPDGSVHPLSQQEGEALLEQVGMAVVIFGKDKVRQQFEATTLGLDQIRAAEAAPPTESFPTRYRPEVEALRWLRTALAVTALGVGSVPAFSGRQTPGPSATMVAGPEGTVAAPRAVGSPEPASATPQAAAPAPAPAEAPAPESALAASAATPKAARPATDLPVAPTPPPAPAAPAAPAASVPGSPASPVAAPTPSPAPRIVPGTTGTGRIRYMNRVQLANGVVRMRVEGIVDPGLLARGTAPKPGQLAAIEYNADSKLLTQAERVRFGLGTYEWGHVWGPGFGDEAPYLTLNSPQVNRELQSLGNDLGIEGFIRQLAEMARRQGGRVELVVVATSFPDPLPGMTERLGEAVLKSIRYEIELVFPGRAPIRGVATIEAGPPPTGIGILDESGLAPLWRALGEDEGTP